MMIQKALDKLYSLHTFGIKLGLDNIKGFLDYLNNPQSKIRMFHVAGSNGKGSTSAFIASILMECGYKTGLYTSPHFVRFNERITIDGLEIDDEYVAGFISDNENYIDEHKVTFFETTTAMAFKYFADREVDYAVIETGLGGRLDATNVQMPEAVIITSISLEHTNILGDTIKKIAGEKAAIIKDKVNVFTGSLPEEAMKVIESKCAETNSRLYKIKDYMNIRNGEPELYTEELEIDDWSIPLKGNYQKFNAVLAALVVSKTLMLDNFHTINKGILNVVKNTRIQGRYEYYRRSPDIIFDSAHNPEGVENFLSEFAKDETLYGRKVLLFGAMKDKAIKEMLTLLKEYFDEIHVTSVEYERACGIEDLIKIAAEINIQVIHEKEPVDFINKFEDREKDDCLVVLGSIYLVGALKSLIKHDNIA